MEQRTVKTALRVVDGPVAEAALLRAAMKGDAAALEQLFVLCAPDLTSWVSRVVLGSADAQDIVQDTFVTVFTQLQALRQPEAFRGWLRTIALTHVRRRFRTQRLLRRLGFTDVEPLEARVVDQRRRSARSGERAPTGRSAAPGTARR